MTRLPRSKEFNKVVRLAIAGDFTSAQKALANAKELFSGEAQELDALISFQQGKTIDPCRNSRLKKLFWLSLVRSRLVHGSLKALIKGTCVLLRITGSQVKVFDSYYRYIWPSIIYWRYGDFLSGYIHSYILHLMAPASRELERIITFSVFAHFECMSGRFDLGLVKFDRCIPLIEALHKKENKDRLENPTAYLYYIEAVSIYALHLGYTGYFDRAKERYNYSLREMEKRPSFFTEVFLRSMRMQASLEVLDEESLHKDALRLKQLLGDSNMQKYALRTSAFSALLSAIKKDFVSVQSQLLAIEKQYAATIHPVELGRYHFIRSMIELELGNPSGAMMNVNRALSMLTPLPGAVFFGIDALLMKVEVQLRARLYSPDQLLTDREIKQYKKLLSKAKFFIRGAPLISARIQLAEALLGYVAGDFEHLAEPCRRLEKEAQVSGWRRVLYVLSHIKPNQAPASAVIPWDGSNRADMDHSILDLINQIVVSENLEESSKNAICRLFSGTSCTTESLPLEDSRFVNQTPFIIRQPSQERVEVDLFFPEYALRFAVHHPLYNIQFDSKSQSAIKIALSVIYSGYMRINIEEQRVNAALSKLAAQVAHDIRSPLTALNVALNGIDIQDERRSLIHSASNRIQDIAQDLISRYRDLSPQSHSSTLANQAREDSSAPTFTRDCELIAGAVEEVFSEKRFLWQSKMDVQMQLEIEDSARFAFSKVSIVCFKRILSNLMNNALESLPDSKGSIRVSVNSDQGQVVTSVRDTGCGIPDEIKGKLGKERFSYGKSSSESGTGLGLSHAFISVQKWKGKIDIQSQTDKGTDITIYLPRTSKPDQYVTELDLNREQTVVIYDDEPSVHSAWKQRFIDCSKRGERDYSIRCCLHEDHFIKTIKELREAGRHFICLVDYGIRHSERSGLQSVINQGVADKALLVTSRHSDHEVLEAAKRHKVTILPKQLIPYVPIVGESAQSLSTNEVIAHSEVNVGYTQNR